MCSKQMHTKVRRADVLQGRSCYLAWDGSGTLSNALNICYWITQSLHNKTKDFIKQSVLKHILYLKRNEHLLNFIFDFVML